ncbi:OmpA family protein [Streptomyces sp. DSM 42041]|uniref:OmpA family protein n=1 Tax=Streptomyces hazeniae TaxID=3075538 RepID=A0ABU2NWY3_9ACTN|nr:OmpA family protein [Streptomyces sp. DSM 42041]MDT0381007.1 OmpA family protein [Streptomyces sp. DSM 42041]
MTPRPRARVLRSAACTSVSVLVLAGVGATGAHADPTDPPAPPSLPGAANPTTIPTDDPALPGEDGGPAPSYSEPPDNIGDAEPPVEVDPQAVGLELADGARLAPPKVLDIKFVTETMTGEQRRADSNTKTTFTLQAEVLFPKNSAKLNNEARARIEDIATEIEGQGATEVNVFGFTDNLGSYAHGEVLSKQRANAVQKELAGELDPGITFQVRGYSEDYPIADNSSEEGRKKNRRVEVSFAREG